MLSSNPGRGQPLSASLCSDPGDVLIRSTRANLRVQRHEAVPLQNTDPSAAPRPGRAPPLPADDELQTIQLPAGSRGAGLEALRQRCQSAPQRKQVRVTLLDSPRQSAEEQDHSLHSVSGLESPSNNPPGVNQLDMKKVTELTESVQKLLQQYRGQSVREEALHGMETVQQQQLFLQNQLLDSALKIALRTQALPTAHLSSEPRAAEMLPATVAPSCCCERATESLPAESASLTANQVLREVGLLRSEMKALLTQREEPKKSPETEPRPSPSKENRPRTQKNQSPRIFHRPGLSALSRCHPTRNQAKTTTQSQPKSVKESQIQATISEPQRSNVENHEGYIQYLEERIRSHQEHLRNQNNQTRTREEEEEEERDEAQPHHSQNRTKRHQESQKSQVEQRNRGTQTNTQNGRQHRQNGGSSKQGLSSPDCGRVLGGLQGLEVCGAEPQSLGGSGAGLQRVLGPQSSISVLHEARLVLKNVQRQRKVLEENLESQFRARTGDLLHCHLNALAQNRDCSDEIRIKKTVDSLISTLSQEIQVEVQKSSVKPDSARTKVLANRNTANRRKPASLGRVRPQSTLRTTPTKPTRTSTKPPSDLSADPELYLRRLYGKAAYERQRRSLKRSPYLRLNSPVSPSSAPWYNRPRPRIVESVRGVKLKSCKTQTSPEPGLDPGLGLGLGLGPGPVQSGSSFPLTAIPLRRPRIDSSHRGPGGSDVPVQSLPSAGSDITHQSVETSGDAVREDEQEAEASEAAVPLVVNILQSAPVQEEQEEVEFPGTHFLSVADMEQAPDASEEVLQLEGGPGPDPVQYQGPLFPPQPPPSALTSAQGQSLDLGLSIHREALEERLVQWVEQQLMSRFICEMSRPPPTDPTRTCYDYQSEPEERPEPAHRLSPIQSEHNIASDLNHGDSSLQLQVESGLNLDSDQVRGLVLEVLTEIVALFLGSRESQEPETGSRTKPGSELGGELEETEPNRVETPEVATPEPTPVHTPPPALQTPPLSPVATPTPTPPLLSDWPNANENLPPEPVATPPLTPPVTCPNAESPLAERQEESDKPRIPTPPVFAPPPDSTPAPVSSPPPPEPPTPPNASSSPSSSPSSPSFSSPGATHSAPRHISEGELLLSLRHLQAIHEDGCSFSSSLHELQEMDPDPPSEGQIHSSSILLSFITKMQQREPRPQPEGSGFLEEEEEVSAGEIQDELIKDVTNQERSPGQASPITGDVLEWTNQSALSEGVLTSDLLDSHLLQTSAPVCTPKPNADLELDQGQDAPKNQDPPKNQETLKTLDQNQNQSQDQTKDQTKDQSRDPETLQRSSQEREGGVWGAGGAGGGVWEEGGPGVLTVDVFVPSPDEGAVASDSSSDVF